MINAIPGVRFLLLLATTAATISGCATEPPARRPEFSGGYPTYDCPEQLEGQVRVSAEVTPLDSVAPRENGVRTIGTVGRRIAVAVDPAGLSRDDRIVWSSTSVQSYGGTFAGWSALSTPHATLPTTSTAAPAGTESPAEVVTVTSSPGQIKINRIARDQTDLSGIYSIDASITPGGRVVDDTIMTSLNLWRKDGSALPVSDVGFTLAPLRHPPGLDIVSASVNVDYIVRVGATREEWACSAQARVTLVDQDAVRQPLWDLGLAAPNGSRAAWLALFRSDVGAIRMVFDSPEAANSFANWLQVSRATEVQGYAIGSFTQGNRSASRPYVVVDAEAMKSFKLLEPTDVAAIKVGSVGER